MIIKASKDYHYTCVLCILAVVFCSVLLWAKSHNMLVVCAMCVPALFLAVNAWVAGGRTLIMNEKGCTIQFFGVRRFYAWSELQTKKIEDYAFAIGSRQPYKKGAVFFKKKCHKPKWLKPFDYCMFFHPFRFFFVYFNPHIVNPKWTYAYFEEYVVDEESFLKKMEEWQVELTKR